MAGFKTHITTSTLVGAGLGAAGYTYFDLRPETCFIAGGLCSVAGILPDVDSESGQTVREITGFAAVLIPFMLLDKFANFPISHETVVVVGVSLYILVRFGLAALINKMTVHRGMWHSIPAALTASLITSWLCFCPELFPRFFKVLGVFLGYMSHLILDEYYSFEIRKGRFRIKKSLGTALKIWGDRYSANLIAYSLLIGMYFFTIYDPQLTGKPGPHPALQIAEDTLMEYFPNWKPDSNSESESTTINVGKGGHSH